MVDQEKIYTFISKQKHQKIIVLTFSDSIVELLLGDVEIVDVGGVVLAVVQLNSYKYELIAECLERCLLLKVKISSAPMPTCSNGKQHQSSRYTNITADPEYFMVL